MRDTYVNPLELAEYWVSKLTDNLKQWEKASDELVKLGAFVIPKLFAILDSDDNLDSWVVRGIWRAVGRMGPTALPDLVDALQHDKWEIREDAVRTLMRAARAVEPRIIDVVPALITALDDENEYVRTAVLQALMLVPKQRLQKHKCRVVPAFIKRLKDEDSMNRQHAATALQGVADREDGSVLGALTEALLDDDRFVRAAASMTLNYLRKGRIVFLRDIILDDDDDDEDMAAGE